MAKGRKTGGRVRGSSFNHNLRTARNRMRKTFLKALPRLQEWLTSPQTWKQDGAAAAKIVAALGEWSAPRFGRLDANEAQAAATAAPAALPAPDLEQILLTFKSITERPRQLETPSSPGEPAAETVLPVGNGLQRMPEREGAALRYAGIPLEHGGSDRYIPAPPAGLRPAAPRNLEPPAQPLTIEQQCDELNRELAKEAHERELANRPKPMSDEALEDKLRKDGDLRARPDYSNHHRQSLPDADVYVGMFGSYNRR